MLEFKKEFCQEDSCDLDDSFSDIYSYNFSQAENLTDEEIVCCCKPEEPHDERQKYKLYFKGQDPLTGEDKLNIGNITIFKKNHPPGD